MSFNRAPCYIDAHVHISDLRGLAAVAGAGVCAVRDAGTTDGAGLGANAEDRKDMPPIIVSAGRALSKKGGYGSMFGKQLESRDEIKDEILKLRSEGAAIIKVMASGAVSLKRPGTITSGGFDRSELVFIVNEAAVCGLAVMAHANGEQAIIDAAEAGAWSIEHGFFMSERALEVMARRKVFWVPTVDALKRAAGSRNRSKEAGEFVARLIDAHLLMIGHAHAAGVPLAVGTDFVLPGSGYREAYQRELSFLRAAGLSHIEALTIACEGGARLLGI